MNEAERNATGKNEPPKFVYVLAADGTPLMPTRHLGKVRQILGRSRGTNSIASRTPLRPTLAILEGISPAPPIKDAPMVSRQTRKQLAFQARPQMPRARAFRERVARSISRRLLLGDDLAQWVAPFGRPFAHVSCDVTALSEEPFTVGVRPIAPNQVAWRLQWDAYGNRLWRCSGLLGETTRLASSQNPVSKNQPQGLLDGLIEARLRLPVLTPRPQEPRPVDIDLELWRIAHLDDPVSAHGDLMALARETRRDPSSLELLLEAKRARLGDVSKNFGAAVRRARLMAGLTQRELGHAAGLTQGQVSAVERGLGSARTTEECCRVLADIGQQNLGTPHQSRPKGSQDVTTETARQRFGHEARSARQRRGLSQTRLARDVGLSQTTVSMVENGRQVRREALESVARELGIQVPEEIR